MRASFQEQSVGRCYLGSGRVIEQGQSGRKVDASRRVVLLPLYGAVAMSDLL